MVVEVFFVGMSPVATVGGCAHFDCFRRLRCAVDGLDQVHTGIQTVLAVRNELLQLSPHYRAVLSCLLQLCQLCVELFDNVILEKQIPKCGQCNEVLIFYNLMVRQVRSQRTCSKIPTKLALMMFGVRTFDSTRLDPKPGLLVFISPIGTFLLPLSESWIPYFSRISAVVSFMIVQSLTMSSLVVLFDVTVNRITYLPLSDAGTQ